MNVAVVDFFDDEFTAVTVEINDERLDSALVRLILLFRENDDHCNVQTRTQIITHSKALNDVCYININKFKNKMSTRKPFATVVPRLLHSDVIGLSFFRFMTED